MKKLDPTGQRLGNLTVLRPSENISGVSGVVGGIRST